MPDETCCPTITIQDVLRLPHGTMIAGEANGFKASAFVFYRGDGSSYLKPAHEYLRFDPKWVIVDGIMKEIVCGVQSPE